MPRKTLADLATLPPRPEPMKLDMPVPTIRKGISSDPEQDAALRLFWGPQGFAFSGDTVTRGPTTATTLADLRDLLDDLKRQMGDQNDDLYRLTKKLRFSCAAHDRPQHCERLDR